MKICYVTTNICVMNGLARVTIAKANALAAIPGNQVAIVVRYQKEAPLRPLDQRVRLIQLDLFYPEDDLTTFGDVDHFIPLREMRRRLDDYRYRLTTVLGKLRPDIIISTGTDEVRLIGAMDLPWQPVRLREFHLASDWHPQMKPQLSLWKRWGISLSRRRDYRTTLRQYDRFVVLTDSDRHTFWHDDARVVTIPNPLTLDAEPLPSQLDQKIVVASGRICRQKNFELLARAWALVAQQHPGWQLRLYGDGKADEVRKLQRQISACGVGESFRLMGRTRNMIGALREASAFVLSSRYEGFGLVLTEAMACGVPVVSTNCPYGPSDIITDGRDGFLVPMNDAEALADRLCRLISDSTLRQRMGQAARQAAQRYRLDAIIPQWMKLFEEILEEKNPRASR